MVIVKDKSYLVKARINVGEFFGLSDEDAFVELREPDTFDAQRLNEASKKAQETGDQGVTIELFRELLPRLVVDHSLYKSETEKMTPEEVTAVVVDKMAIFSKVVEAYAREVLFILGKRSDGK